MKTNVRSVMVAVGAFAVVTGLSSGAEAQQVPQPQRAGAPVQRPGTPVQRASAQAQNGVQETPGQPMPYPTTPVYPTTPYRAQGVVGAEQVEYARPNMPLLAAGGIAFLGAYVPSFVVAASSDHDGDKWLYAPLVGPWIDLASRGCDNDVELPTCGTNGFDRAGLITSGVAQAIGVAAIFGGFTLPTKRIVTTTGTIQFAPTSFDRHSHGLVAFGNF